MKRYFPAPLLFTVSVMAFGATTEPAEPAKPSAVMAFKEKTQQQMDICSGTKPSPRRKNSGAKIASQDPKKSCVLAGHEQVRNVFPAALKEVSDNPAATELLKEFFSAWLASFDNLSQGERESAAQFEKRRAERQAKYEDLWQLFEKETEKKK